jgi:hypothetical protein
MQVGHRNAEEGLFFWMGVTGSSGAWYRRVTVLQQKGSEVE